MSSDPDKPRGGDGDRTGMDQQRRPVHRQQQGEIRGIQEAPHYRQGDGGGQLRPRARGHQEALPSDECLRHIRHFVLPERWDN